MLNRFLDHRALLTEEKCHLHESLIHLLPLHTTYLTGHVALPVRVVSAPGYADLIARTAFWSSATVASTVGSATRPRHGDIGRIKHLAESTGYLQISHTEI